MPGFARPPDKPIVRMAAGTGSFAAVDTLIDLTMLAYELWGPTAIFGTIRSTKRCI